MTDDVPVLEVLPELLHYRFFNENTDDEKGAPSTKSTRIKGQRFLTEESPTTTNTTWATVSYCWLAPGYGGKKGVVFCSCRIRTTNVESNTLTKYVFGGVFLPSLLWEATIVPGTTTRYSTGYEWPAAVAAIQMVFFQWLHPPPKNSLSRFVFPQTKMHGGSTQARKRNKSSRPHVHTCVHSAMVR